VPEKEFDYRLKDSQATEVEPLESENFDIDAYFEYEASLLDYCKKFRQADVMA